MNITDKLLTPGSAHGRNGKSMIPQGIVVHYVGNPGSTAINNRNWFESGAGGAHTSAHYIIGLEGEIIRCLPDTEQGAHAGVSYGPQWNEMVKYNNSKLIAIECCHPDATGKFNNLTMASLIELARMLCAKYSLDPQTHVYRHYDVCGKQCPMYYVKNEAEWQKFKNELLPKPEPGNRIKMLVNGEAFTIEGYMQNDRNYGAVRELLERLGYAVGWENGTVTARK